MNNYHNWFGVGVKGGGTLGLAGFETMEGYIANLGMPSHTHSINMSYLRLGAGLGGGVGLCLIFVFNSINPKVLDQTNDSTWSINVALGGKWADVVKALAATKVFQIAPKLLGGLVKATKFDLDNIRNSASYIFTTYELTQQTKNKVVAIDIPFAGVGAEISAQALYGTIFIGDVMMHNTNNGRITDPAITRAGQKRRGEM